MSIQAMWMCRLSCAIKTGTVNFLGAPLVLNELFISFQILGGDESTLAQY